MRAPEELVAEGQRRWGRGDVSGAVQEFGEILALYPHDVDLRFLYAAGLFLLKRYQEALPQYEAVVRAEPLHEWASLGLFHSRWKTGFFKEAMSEAKRFYRAGGESMEYRRMIKEILQSLEAL